MKHRKNKGEDLEYRGSIGPFYPYSLEPFKEVT
jgi:hypothetical protein